MMRIHFLPDYPEECDDGILDATYLVFITELDNGYQTLILINDNLITLCY
ncbi:hypothetical protein [Vibrio azureus]|nr:hypothetical protein [Vibrio azureus]